MASTIRFYLLAAILLMGGPVAGAAERPNIVLLMTDDQGWGDVAFHGHRRLKTPHLNAMAANGLLLERFYAASAVCSPTRASCLTGKHPSRFSIHSANTGHMPAEEQTLAESLRAAGYRTGHFGKWHLGTLTTTMKDSNRGGPEKAIHYSPPWENGFDVCFSTEAKTPTYNPMVTPPGWTQAKNPPGGAYGTHYWTGPDAVAMENLAGDDSRVIMDRALPFIEDAVASNTPFFSVIWFHAPHLPVEAGKEHRAPYADLSDFAQRYLGCITAMDEQVGRLRSSLRALGVHENTLIWFCSDNGPEDAVATEENGSSGPFQGRKRSLHEGGIRVPAMVEWPGTIAAGRASHYPAVTSDYVPTIAALLDIAVGPGQLEDGQSLVPLLRGEVAQRGKPIGFSFKAQRVWMEDRYKLYSSDEGKTWALYDLPADPGEAVNLADKEPERVAAMAAAFARWEADCLSDGAAYPWPR